MGVYVVAHSGSKLTDLLNKMKIMGKPQKADVNWLKAQGFSSNADQSLLSVLRFIGFIDNARKPTDSWQAFKGGNSKIVLANAIRKGYQQLFEMYPCANTENAMNIRNFMSANSPGGQSVIDKAVRTFQTLCKEADFSNTENEPKQVNRDIQEKTTPAIESQLPTTPSIKEPTTNPSLHIDIQIHISSEASATQIDNIFDSMARHLYKKESE